MPEGLPPLVIDPRETTPGDPTIPADFPAVWPQARPILPDTAHSIRVIYFGHGDHVRVINEIVIARRDDVVDVAAILGSQGFRGASRESTWMAEHDNGTRVVFGRKDHEELFSFRREYPVEEQVWTAAVAHLRDCAEWGPFNAVVGLVTDTTLVEFEQNGTRHPTKRLSATIDESVARKFRQIGVDLDFEPIDGEPGEEVFARTIAEGAYVVVSLSQTVAHAYHLSLASIDPANVGVAVAKPPPP